MATSLRDAGWQVTVVCPRPVEAGRGSELNRVDLQQDRCLEGITVHRFPLGFANRGFFAYMREYLIAFVAIARLSWMVWRQEHFDVIHLCNPPDIFFPICMVYRLLGAKVVFDHHDLFPEMVLARFGGAFGRGLYWLARLGEYLTMRCAHTVIEPNEAYLGVAEARGGYSVEKSVVVRNGPRRGEFDRVDPVAELRRGFPHMVCYVGIMGEEDGVLEMVEVIDRIVAGAGRRDVLFALVGDGACRSRALATVEMRGLTPYVDMPGMISDTLRLRQYMSTADILVSPEPMTPLNARSTFVKIAEYMAVGKPIVATDLPETRYTAQEAARYVRPGDALAFAEAIIELLDDPSQRQLMGMRGQERVASELTWERQVPNLLRAYGLN